MIFLRRVNSINIPKIMSPTTHRMAIIPMPIVGSIGAPAFSASVTFAAIMTAHIRAVFSVIALHGDCLSSPGGGAYVTVARTIFSAGAQRG